MAELRRDARGGAAKGGSAFQGVGAAHRSKAKGRQSMVRGRERGDTPDKENPELQLLTSKILEDEDVRALCVCPLLPLSGRAPQGGRPAAPCQACGRRAGAEPVVTLACPCR
jgi:hypothetical protein